MAEESDELRTEDTLAASVTFSYIKSPAFRTIHVDGVHGGVTPQGKLGLAFFSERFPVPVQTTHEFSPEHQVGEERMEARVSRTGIVRELEFHAVMDVEVAKSVAKWIADWVKKAEELKNAGGQP